jgi:shikimate dehydrogenase
MENKIKAAVIGDPISHSLSPKIHNFFLQKYGINGSYEAKKISKENLLKDVQQLVAEGFAGFNVTLPHKEEIYKICDHLSRSAKLCGAVNTVIITPDKKLFGHNSDAAGFINNFKNHCPDFNPKQKTAFVIGAGGAARAIVYALIDFGFEKIFITNRNQTRAENLLKNFANFAAQKNCQLQFLPEVKFAKKLDQCDLLVNSTSLGMIGQPALSLDLALLKNSAIVYDIVYKPLQTVLLRQAQAQGNVIVTGIGMLIEQALVGFEAWFKTKPQPDEKLINLITR